MGGVGENPLFLFRNQGNVHALTEESGNMLTDYGIGESDRI
jgi:hypothetical protein